MHLAIPRCDRNMLERNDSPEVFADVAELDRRGVSVIVPTPPASERID